MKSQCKLLAATGMLLTAFSANAVQRDITVIAEIDPTVDVTLSDGSPLPASITMQYLPNKGLAAQKENIKFWSNTTDRAININLANMPALTDANGSNAIPLKVSINGQTLSTTAISLAYATTFPGGIANGSSTMPLVIEQATKEMVKTAGSYAGIVSLVVTQATGAK